MSQKKPVKIGLLIGAESDWPEALMTAVQESGENAAAELVKIGSIMMDEAVNFDVIIDRMSHKVPFYRAYAKHAAMHGVYLINNPFIWDVDSKFLGTAVLAKLGLKSPRTVILPNKYIESETTPDTFRNLKYPMDWDAIIAYVGVPAIFKDIHSGGRQFASRVHNVDELIQRYDESNTRTTVLQEIVASTDNLHAFVIGQQDVMILHYSHANGTYLPGFLATDEGLGQKLAESARRITQIYQYDVNMVEFVVKNENIYVINNTNPVPDIDRRMMSGEQFGWCIRKMAQWAIERGQRPLPQENPFTSGWND